MTAKIALQLEPDWCQERGRAMPRDSFSTDLPLSFSWAAPCWCCWS